ncbi:MAG: hypothetical protein HY319_31415 [Armatimonadetes bacterium]|nr:hypothetical protein [Armatimonadota bacterium]
MALYPADGANTSDGGLTGPLQGEPNRHVGQWVELSGSELTLEPGAETHVDVRFRVPEDAAPGDHFGFVFVQNLSEPAERPSEEGQASFAVKLRTRFGITLWERVPGPHQAGLELEPPRKNIEEGQLLLAFDVVNTGNVFLKPEGTWRLLGPDGARVLEREEGQWGYLLPGSRLVMRVPVNTERPLARGVYRFQVDVRYAVEGETRTRTAEFPLDLP